MRVDVTSRLKDNEDPIMVISDGVEVTVKADASSVLQILGIMNEEENNIGKMQKAQEVLFSTEDAQKLKTLNYMNWATAIGLAVQLAVSGEIKDEEDQKEGELPSPTMI